MSERESMFVREASAYEEVVQTFGRSLTARTAFRYGYDFGNEHATDDLKAEIDRLRSQLAGHHEADVLGRTIGITTTQAWGKLCPICELLVASPKEGADGE